MPEGNIFHGCQSITANQTGHTRNTLTGNRITLMRHSRGPLLTWAEIFLSLTDIGALEITNLSGKLFKGACYDSESSHVLSMTVTLNNLSSQRSRSNTQLLANQLFNLWINVGISTNSTGELTNGNNLLGMLHTLNVTVNLIHPESQLQAKGHWLCVDTMGTADANCVLELSCAALQYLTEFFQIINNQLGGFLHHNAKGSILNITGSQSLVNILGIIAYILSHIGQESNNIMVGFLLNLLYSIQLEMGLFTNVPGSLLWNLP